MTKDAVKDLTAYEDGRAEMLLDIRAWLADVIVETKEHTFDLGEAYAKQRIELVEEMITALTAPANEPSFRAWLGKKAR